MKKFAKNNKGFSLVELIVVVLIMAIIAVALSPQVMKWVNNSRIANDASNFDTLTSELKLALTNENAYAAASSATYYLAVGKKGTVLIGPKEGGVEIKTSSDAVHAALTAVDSSWATLTAQASVNLAGETIADTPAAVAPPTKCYLITADKGVVAADNADGTEQCPAAIDN